MPIHHRDKIHSWLKEHVSTARYRHTLGTVRVAIELAKKHKISAEKAELAALLHDAGKGMPAAAMVRYAARRRLSFPAQAEVIRFNPSLLHSHISADIARRLFGVVDREILVAICQHTVGAPRMSTLAKIIYLADTTSPDRRRWGIKRLRRMMKHDLDRAMLMAICEKTSYVLTQRKWLHPQAAAAWNYFVTLERSTRQP